jgi:hypothetical protein
VTTKDIAHEHPGCSTESCSDESCSDNGDHSPIRNECPPRSSGRNSASESVRPDASRLTPNLTMVLGAPMDIAEVAALLGCSEWTVRQRYMPRGLPHLRQPRGQARVLSQPSH